MAIQSHKFRSVLVTSAAILVIFLAIIFSGFRLLVLLASDYADDVEHELNQLLGVPVSIEKLDADIHWLSPRLKLINVNFYDVKYKTIFHSDEINISLNWLSSIQRMKLELGEVSLSGAGLNIHREKSGQFSVQGFTLGGNQSSTIGLPEEAQSFLSSASLSIIDSHIQWHDKKNNQQFDLNKVNIVMANDGEHHQLAISFNLPKNYGKKINIRIDYNGDLMQPEKASGKIYGHFEDIKLKKWLDDFSYLSGITGNGKLDTNIWLSFNSNEIKEFSSELNVESLFLELNKNKSKHEFYMEELNADFLWRMTADGWDFQSDVINLKRNKNKWQDNSIFKLSFNEAEKNIDVTSSFIRSEDVLAMLLIPMQFYDGEIRQQYTSVLKYDLQGDFINTSFNMFLNEPDRYQVKTEFKGVSAGFKQVYEFNIQGIDGYLSSKKDDLNIAIKSNYSKISISPLFRDVLLIDNIDANIHAFKVDNDWYIQSNAFNLNTPDVETQSSFEFTFDKEGRFNSDLQVYFKNGDVSSVAKYLPVDIMDKDLIDWIDNALIAGDVVDGQFLLHGDLARFPFYKKEGVMQAVLNVKNVDLNYYAEWPVVNAMQAEVFFSEKGMSIEQASANINHVNLERTRVEIADFNEAVVFLDAQAKGLASNMLGFVKNSPLNDSLSYVSQFEAKAEAGLSLQLSIPLTGDELTTVKGKITFENNEIYIPSENYRFKDVQGILNFTENSVSSENIDASLDGEKLSLKILNVESIDEHYALIETQITSSVDSLLAPLPELKPYLSGLSLWDIDIKIPLDDSQEIVSVQVISALEGVKSTLPMMFSKNKNEKKDLKLNLSVSSDSDLSIDVALGSDTRLSTKRLNDFWMVNLNSNEIKGHAFFVSDFTQDTAAVVDLQYLDISSLMTSEEDSGFSIKPSMLPPLNAHIDQFKINKMLFADINLQTARNKNGMFISQLSLKSKGVKARIKGSWMSSWRYQHQTSLDIDLDFSNLGDSLKNLDISSAIRRGKGRVLLKWQWAAEPYNFDWDLLEGNGSLKIRDGRLNDVNAGAGRLLGVLNFKTFLLMDFGSQVSDGFPFDKVQGNLDFNNGIATINKLEIDSQVADVDINGYIGLSDETFDQVLTVKPAVGSTLTVLGAVAGGPVTAAAVHLFQKLFGVDEIAEYKYTVKGSWDKPDVKLISIPEKSQSQNSEELDDDDL